MIPVADGDHDLEHRGERPGPAPPAPCSARGDRGEDPEQEGAGGRELEGGLGIRVPGPRPSAMPPWSGGSRAPVRRRPRRGGARGGRRPSAPRRLGRRRRRRRAVWAVIRVSVDGSSSGRNAELRAHRHRSCTSGRRHEPRHPPARIRSRPLPVALRGRDLGVAAREQHPGAGPRRAEVRLRRRHRPDPGLRRYRRRRARAVRRLARLPDGPAADRRGADARSTRRSTSPSVRSRSPATRSTCGSRRTPATSASRAAGSSSRSARRVTNGSRCSLVVGILVGIVAFMVWLVVATISLLFGAACPLDAPWRSSMRSASVIARSRTSGGSRISARLPRPTSRPGTSSGQSAVRRRCSHPSGSSPAGARRRGRPAPPTGSASRPSSAGSIRTVTVIRGAACS